MRTASCVDARETPESLESVPQKKNLSNEFGEWLGAYWALTLEDALRDGVTRKFRVQEVAKAGRALHKAQTGNDSGIRDNKHLENQTLEACIIANTIG